MNETRKQIRRMTALAGEIERLEAELARVTTERDKLIDGWPGFTSERGIEFLGNKYLVILNSDSHRFPNRAEAVRFAAGLDREPKGVTE